MAVKKELKTRLVPNRGSLLEIYYEGGGEVPEVLKGMYTSMTDALLAIQKFQAGVRKAVNETTKGKAKAA